MYFFVTKLMLCFRYSNWQDHKMANPQEVLALALQILEIIDSNKTEKIPSKPPQTKRQKSNEKKLSTDGIHINCNKPVVVHCSAGIGRTGCFLAVLNGMQQLRCNYNVDVLAILCSLRLNRGGLVQTAEQYELVHRVLSLYSDLI